MTGTVALRRVDPAAQGSIVDVLDEAGVLLLPNTAGCYTARDAVVTAKLAREAFGTDWVKLEVIGASAAAPEIVWATGHYRNGALLTPVTADLVVAELCGEPGDPAFSPQRFAGVAA